MTDEKRTHLTHPFEPVFDKNSEILILGSFPSVKSRENSFYYGHAQNRFWKVTSSLYGCSVPVTISEKTDFLNAHKIALWDVIGSCSISKSSDSSIKDALPNDIPTLISETRINRIFLNGKTAYGLYLKFFSDLSEKIPSVCLPSTSPANAAWNTEKLTEAWSVILGK